MEDLSVELAEKMAVVEPIAELVDPLELQAALTFQQVAKKKLFVLSKAFIPTS